MDFFTGLMARNHQLAVSKRNITYFHTNLLGPHTLEEKKLLTSFEDSFLAWYGAR